MTHDHSHHSRQEEPRPSFFASRAFLVFLGFAAIALVLLWQEHQAHILGAIPYLFILACPLMHIFLHGGHDGHGHGSHGRSRDGRTRSDNDGGRP